MIFQKTDKDNDHKISRSEFIQHMKLTRCIAAGQWDVLFDELDADNNGALSIDFGKPENADTKNSKTF